MPRKPLIAVIAAALIAASLGLSACGDDDSSEATTTEAPAATAPATTAAPATTEAPAGGTVQVEADPSGQLAFVQTALTAPAGTDTFVLTNDAPVPHNIAIEGNGVDTPPSDTIQGGGTAELTVDLEPGEYTFYCEVPGHREAGMEGTLTVN